MSAERIVQCDENVAARQRQQAAIIALGREALAATDLPGVFDSATALVIEILGVDYCAILELLPDGAAVRLASCMGSREGYDGNLTLPVLPDSHVGLTLLTHEPVVVDTLPTETCFGRESFFFAHQVVGGIAVRIECPQQAFGILGAYTLQPRRFNADETYFLQAVAYVLAASIARHQTEEALPQARDDAVLRMKNQMAELRTENQQLSAELHRLKRVEQQLAHAVMHDPLTGLPNRALFSDRLEHALERAKRRDEPPFAVLFLDLDSFKNINDCFGHLVADQLLVKIARRLEVCVRPGDTVARFAGDEFTLLLMGLVDARRAPLVADRICRRLASPIYIDEHEIRLTGSIGIVSSSPEYDHPDAMLNAADLAMYQAKAKGKARFVVLDPALHGSAERVRGEFDLGHAVVR